MGKINRIIMWMCLCIFGISSLWNSSINTQAASDEFLLKGENDKVRVKSGEIFQVTFTYSADNKDIRGFQALLHVDDARYEVQSVTCSENLKDYMVIASPSDLIKDYGIMTTGSSLPQTGSLTYEIKAIGETGVEEDTIDLSLIMGIDKATNKHTNQASCSVLITDPTESNDVGEDSDFEKTDSPKEQESEKTDSPKEQESEKTDSQKEAESEKIDNPKEVESEKADSSKEAESEIPDDSIDSSFEKVDNPKECESAEYENQGDSDSEEFDAYLIGGIFLIFTAGFLGLLYRGRKKNNQK